jgi:hypothetical protein
LTCAKTHESFDRNVKLRLALVVMALLMALAGAESATAASTGPEATASAKQPTDCGA